MVGVLVGVPVGACPEVVACGVGVWLGMGVALGCGVDVISRACVGVRVGPAVG